MELINSWRKIFIQLMKPLNEPLKPCFTIMPIATRFVKITLTVILSFFIIISLQAQEADTVHVKPFERYWTKAKIIPKVGFGVQDTGFGEIGIASHQIYVHPLSLASAGPYMTVDGVFEPDEIIVGPKI